MTAAERCAEHRSPHARSPVGPPKRVPVALRGPEATRARMGGFAHPKGKMRDLGIPAWGIGSAGHQRRSAAAAGLGDVIDHVKLITRRFLRIYKS